MPNQMSENQYLDEGFVAGWAACPVCGENDQDNLINDDGLVHCATCGHDYDLEPERQEATSGG